MGRFRLAVIAAVGVLALQLWSPGAHADQVYHSQKYALTPVDGAPLRSGFVENIHANGPQVYAHELYVLKGASPASSYQVLLSIWVSNTECSGDPDLQVPSDVMSTNEIGNGWGQKIFTPEDADGLRGHTVSAVWQFLLDGAPAYETGCEVLTLD
ncbi:MAG TPA: hypothetical protein VEQ37_05345 [Actinomycetota bacterium]|nr:hypothetical protein [Actinomycetota bacterium]